MFKNVLAEPVVSPESYHLSHLQGSFLKKKKKKFLRQNIQNYYLVVENGNYLQP